MKIKTDYEHCPYITAGKEYEVKDLFCGIAVFDDDYGEEVWVSVEEPSPHLDNIGMFEVIDE